MMPKQEARADIDPLLTTAGWHVSNNKTVEINPKRRVAVREFELVFGHGNANYMLYLNRNASVVIEAEKEGALTSGTEIEPTKVCRPPAKR